MTFEKHKLRSSFQPDRCILFNYFFILTSGYSKQLNINHGRY